MSRRQFSAEYREPRYWTGEPKASRSRIVAPGKWPEQWSGESTEQRPAEQMRGITGAAALRLPAAALRPEVARFKCNSLLYLNRGLPGSAVYDLSTVRHRLRKSIRIDNSEYSGTRNINRYSVNGIPVGCG